MKSAIKGEKKNSAFIKYRDTEVISQFWLLQMFDVDPNVFWYCTLHYTRHIPTSTVH